MALKRKPTGMVSSSRKRAKTSGSYKRYSRPTNRAKRINGRVTIGSGAEEQKFYDETGNTTTFTAGATSVVYPILDNIAQGTSSSGTRIGNKIIVKSLSTKMNWTANSSTGTQIIPQVRISVVLDKQPNIGVPNYADIYTTIATQENLSQRNNNGLDRFQVLKEYCLLAKDWLLGENPAGTLAYANAYWECYIPADIAVRFRDSTGNPETNNLLMCIGTNATVNSAITIAGQYNRVRYTDA